MTLIATRLLQDEIVLDRIRTLVEQQIHKVSVLRTRASKGDRFKCLDGALEGCDIRFGQPIRHPNGYQYVAKVTCRCLIRLGSYTQQDEDRVVQAKCSGFLNVTVLEEARQKAEQDLKPSDFKITLELTMGSVIEDAALARAG